MSGAWSVTLDLLTSSNRRRGSMTVHRGYTEQPLQLDINLLTMEFPVALADAVDRIVTQAAAMLVVPPGSPDGLIEAQAG
jgi:hypothetical protein